MSTYFTDIAGALRNRLRTLPSLPELAKENGDFESSSAEELYLEEIVLPAETVQACNGSDGLDEHNGFYQITVCIPDGAGRSTWPDKIADHFKRGSTLTKNSIDVRIVTVSVFPGFKPSDDSFYRVPVSIEYQSFTPAR